MAASGSERLARAALVASAMLAFGAAGVAIWHRREIAPAPVASSDAGSLDPRSAIADLELRLTRNSRDAEAWRALGWAFFQSGRFAESATAYRRDADLEPNRAESWSALGEALVMAGPGNVPADANAAFRTALRHDPKDPRARYFLAVAKDMAGDHRAAVNDWLALLEESPADAPWYGDVRKAIERVAARDKIDVSARLSALKPVATPQGSAVDAIPGPTPDQMRAAAQLPKGQQDAMVTGMVEGLAVKLKTDPGNVDGWIMLIRSRVQLGQEREARQALRAAMSANPSQADRLRAAADVLGIATR